MLAASGAFGSKFDRYPKRSKILADVSVFLARNALVSVG